ncbi:hypothetical protein B0T21DRAFT_450831 [Apiosordaria backusii]|uniref:TauD/TfdA-like domain-containing protein n=1 Tax=Apiosordaria backusii TaxID=314023 RepID=A0AA40EFW0_9PEZI|nr:hypothetical protein B0T21DRAFT_450831 [Apiosordaria backusii]
MAWEPSQLGHTGSHVLTMQERDLAEVRAALGEFKNLELPPESISNKTFPLPTTGPKILSHIRLHLHTGRGFALIRGLPARSMSAEDNMLAFMGLASHFGAQRGYQDSHGNVIGTYSHLPASPQAPPAPRSPVNPTTSDPIHPVQPGPPTNTQLTSIKRTAHVTSAKDWDASWHADMGAEILCLYARDVAAQGGDVLLASALTVAKDLSASAPWALGFLREPDWPIEVGKPNTQTIQCPLLSIGEEAGSVYFGFDSGRLAPLPTPQFRPCPQFLFGPTKTTALAQLELTATRHQFSVRMEPGDMLVLTTPPSSAPDTPTATARARGTSSASMSGIPPRHWGAASPASCGTVSTSPRTGRHPSPQNPPRPTPSRPTPPTSTAPQRFLAPPRSADPDGALSPASGAQHDRRRSVVQ